MEKTKIASGSASLHKIEFGEDNYIVISADNIHLYDNFMNGVKRLLAMGDDLSSKQEALSKRFDEVQGDDTKTLDVFVETAKLNTSFSEEACAIVDSIFGEGTTKKYYKEVYDEIPDFMPDVYLIIDMLEKLTPVIEKVYGKKAERDRKIFEKKAQQYKPQDFKKKAK